MICIYHNLAILLVGRYWGNFKFFAFMNNAATNIHVSCEYVQEFFEIYIFYTHTQGEKMKII